MVFCVSFAECDLEREQICRINLLTLCAVVVQLLQISRTCGWSDRIPQHVYLCHGIILSRWILQSAKVVL